MGLSGQNEELLPWFLVPPLSTRRLPLLLARKIKPLSQSELLEKLSESSDAQAFYCRLNNPGDWLMPVAVTGMHMLLEVSSATVALI